MTLLMSNEIASSMLRKRSNPFGEVSPILRKNTRTDEDKSQIYGIFFLIISILR